jgi:hypothetical protein
MKRVFLIAIVLCCVLLTVFFLSKDKAINSKEDNVSEKEVQKVETQTTPGKEVKKVEESRSSEDGPTPKEKFRPIENELVGIKLGDAIQKVKEVLGEPKDVKEDSGKKILNYDGIKITIKNDSVIKVYVDKTGLKTPRGLVIGENDGMGDGQLDELYGEQDYVTDVGDATSGTDIHYVTNNWEFVVRMQEEGNVYAVWIEYRK